MSKSSSCVTAMNRSSQVRTSRKIASPDGRRLLAGTSRLALPHQLLQHRIGNVRQRRMPKEHAASTRPVGLLLAFPQDPPSTIDAPLRYGPRVDRQLSVFTLNESRRPLDPTRAQQSVDKDSVSPVSAFAEVDDSGFSPLCHVVSPTPPICAAPSAQPNARVIEPYTQDHFDVSVFVRCRRPCTPDSLDHPLQAKTFRLLPLLPYYRKLAELPLIWNEFDVAECGYCTIVAARSGRR